MADSQRKSYNLFDKVTAPRSYTYPASQNTIEAFGQGCSTYIKCLPNTTYTITKIVSSRFAVCYTTSEPLNGVSYRGMMYNHEGTKITITTDSEAQYLYIFYYNSNYDTKTEQEIRDSIMVNSGSTALPYEPYGWLHSLRKLTTATEAVENPLYSDGTAITAYTINGNEEHTGTPSSQNPVMPNGVGERTAQLLDFNTWANNVYVVRGTKVVSGNSITITSTAATCFTGWNTTEYPAAARIPVTEGETIHLTWDTDADDGSSVWIFPNASATGEVHTAASNKSLDYTVPSGVDYITFRLDVATANKTITYSNIMFSSGSTAKPFEPYGYKIPISSASTTTPVYLGEVESTRRIKKLVLTGQEDWGELDRSGGYRFALDIQSALQSDTTVGAKSYCTHLRLVGTGQTYVQDNAYTISGSSELLTTIGTTERLADWKQFLADQYANGTPVTVWYVLATPTTAAVNEPLMKIGDYADTLSNAASIPTTEGANSITVDTTVQPSEFTATWTGWHDSSVKEWDGSDWQ